MTEERVYAKPYDLSQRLLVPIDITECLPEDHLARFVADVTEGLDLSRFSKFEGTSTGPRPYHARMMFNLLFYAYCIGERSSRKIEEKTWTDLAYRYLSGGQHPDHVTIARFREEHLEDLAHLFTQVLQICRKVGLVKCGKVALDGTKMKAQASLRKTKDYETIKRECDELEQEVKRLLNAASRRDREEDTRYGKNARGTELPPELTKQKERLTELKRVRKEMEEEAKARAEEKNEAIKTREEEEERTGRKKRGRKPQPLDETPDETARHNFTDPDSRVMKDTGTKAFVQGYNCQNVVDVDTQIVISCGVTQEANDKHQALPMLRKLVESLRAMGYDPREIKKQLPLLADAGYFTEEDLKVLVAEGWNLYVSPDGARSKAPLPRMKGRIPHDMSLSDRMRRKIRTKRGKALYRKRNIVEAPFGLTKEARGIRRFLLRGLRKVTGEWTLINLTHNLLVMHRKGTKVT